MIIALFNQVFGMVTLPLQLSVTNVETHSCSAGGSKHNSSLILAKET